MISASRFAAALPVRALSVVRPDAERLTEAFLRETGVYEKKQPALQASTSSAAKISLSGR